MKQGKLIRRAVSAALAGCMMFTLSAPALAESTDALMQLSMTRRSAVSVLDAENGDTANYGFTIDLNGTTKTVNESNCGDIFEDEKLSYDPTTNKLTNKGTISGELTIDAPNVDVELTGNSFVIYGSNSNLNIKNARNVTLSTNSFSVVGGLYSGNAEINCSGKLTIKNSDPSWSAIQDNLTVHNALEILVEGRFNTVVGGDVKIECACPATFKNNQNGGIARSITYAGNYVYYTSAATDAEAVDPNVTSIPAKTAKYVRIVPKVSYTITADDATITVDGKTVNSAFAGEEVTVTAAGRKNAEFTGWTAEGITLTDDQKANPTVTFTMPDKNVTLTPSYKQYYTITSTDDVTIKVDNDRSTATAKALEGQHIVALANKKDGYVFENWEVDGVTLNTSNSVNYTNFEMPANNVTLTPNYAKLHAIEVVNGKANITSAKEGTKVIVTAEERPGYEFARWKILEGDAELENEKNMTATVTVKGTNVKVKAVYKELHGIAIENGIFTVNGSTAATAKRGDAIVATADADADHPGQKFSHWEVTGVDGLTKEQLENVPLEFTMPKGEVTLKAVFKTLHKIDVKFSTADKDTAIEGETVKITAESRPGYVFDRWEVNNGDVAVVNKNAEETTFVMPDKPVTAVAKYKKLLGITVNSGKAYVEDDVTDAALKGKLVVIKADEIEGKRFDHWKIVSGDVILDNQRAPETKFTMPETAVEITAIYNDLHAITVNNGTADVEEAVIGDTVKITAESREGYVFDRWEVNYGDDVVVGDKNAEETTFTMPDSMVVLTAKYKKQRTVTVIGGTVNGTDSVTALREETVEIKAEYDPYEKKFDHWEVKGPKGWDLEDDQKTNPEFTLTVPKGNVTLTAVYNDYHNITVEGGYATPDRAIAGTQITLTPNLPDDQEFDYWYSTDINLREDQRGNPNLTFKMRDFDIKITAVPKQLYFVDLEDADTTANGEYTRVEVKTGKEVVLVAPEREGFRFNHWEVTSGTVGLIDADKTTAYFTMKSENVRIKAIYDEYHTITMVGGKGTAYDADGKEITSAVVGDKITIVANDRDSHEFNRWKIDPDNVILEDPNADKTAFIMPDEPVSVEAKYKHLQSITMNHGTAYDEDFSETDIAKAKQTITIKAEDRYADGLVFDHWTVDTDNVTLADEYGEKTTFEMVNGAVELTAHYKARVTVFSVPAKFEEGIGEHSDETWEKVGKTATITAEIDKETFPGMEFDYWEVIPTDLDIGNIHSQTISFEVPECEVKLVAHWKASGMNPIVDPDEDLDPGFGVEPESSDGGAGAAIAGVAIGGAAVWGGYEIATRIILNDLLPAGAAIPANRGQLALLIWTEKGKPEPAAQPAFADITDAEQAKAAQWCVEQGLLDAKGDRFEPEGWTPKFKVIEVWNKAFPKQ